MKLIDLQDHVEEIKKKECKICEGKGYVQDGIGEAVHTCWECLERGRLTDGN